MPTSNALSYGSRHVQCNWEKTSECPSTTVKCAHMRWAWKKEVNSANVARYPHIQRKDTETAVSSVSYTGAAVSALE